MKSKIKDSAKDVIVGFNGSGKPLGERDDWDLLAIMAHQSGDPSKIELFEVLPPLDELLEEKVEKAFEQKKQTSKK